LYVSLMSLARASRRPCSPERSPYFAFSGSEALFAWCCKYFSFGPTAGTPCYGENQLACMRYPAGTIALDGLHHPPVTVSRPGHACRHSYPPRLPLLEWALGPWQSGMNLLNMPTALLWRNALVAKQAEMSVQSRDAKRLRESYKTIKATCVTSPEYNNRNRYRANHLFPFLRRYPYCRDHRIEPSRFPSELSLSHLAAPVFSHHSRMSLVRYCHLHQALQLYQS
jgi:hypothetical protein